MQSLVQTILINDVISSICAKEHALQLRASVGIETFG